MERSDKSTIIIVDALSYRGSNEEIERLGIEDAIKKRKDEGFAFSSKHQELLYGVIKTLLDLRDKNIDLIVYSQSMGRSYHDINKTINQYFFEYKQNAENNIKDNNKVRIIIGQTSLFYYLGCMAQNTK